MASSKSTTPVVSPTPTVPTEVEGGDPKTLTRRDRYEAVMDGYRQRVKERLDKRSERAV